MSEQEQSDSQKQETKSSNKGLIIGLAVLSLTMVSAIAWAVGSGKIDVEKLFEEPPPPPVVMLEEPAFKPMEKFVVSINSGYSRNYMAVDITLVSHDPRMPERVDQMNSLMKNTLLKYFSGLNIEQVQNKLSNINQLQADIRHAFLEAAEAYGKTLPIEEVLLTNVVIQ